MPLANGLPYLAIPGPSVMPERVLRAMHRSSPNIYAPEQSDQAAALAKDLRDLAGTPDHVAIYIGNGHAAWEAANSNIFSRGDRALLVSCGHFGQSWAGHARAMGIQVDVLDCGKSVAADPALLEAALRADKSHQIKAVLTTHVDTASGVKNDIAALRAAIDAAGHPALFAVDCIASMGCDEYRMKDWGVDVTVAASQKGLMTPPGLAFVWFSVKAEEVSHGSDLATPYWNWHMRAKPQEFWQYWHGTPPTHHMAGLGEALQMILRDEGLGAVWARHEALAQAVWTAFDAWGQGNPEIGLNVADPAARAHSVTAARIGGRDATRLRKWVEANAGLTLGIGLGMQSKTDPFADAALRVGHMGHVNAHMTLGALSVMDMGLKALGIAHGAGAIEAANLHLARLVGPTNL